MVLYHCTFEYRNVDPMTNAMPRVAPALKPCPPSLGNTVVARAQLHMEIDTAKHLSTFPAYRNTAATTKPPAACSAVSYTHLTLPTILLV